MSIRLPSGDSGLCDVLLQQADPRKRQSGSATSSELASRFTGRVPNICCDTIRALPPARHSVFVAYCISLKKYLTLLWQVRY